ncbi:uncharacterized protein with beta-barrel porin domain [Ereboglobus sp. PH5-10]|uniref:autotransporter outer membrane beta-barrel domain-containing protein n=1 Tax=Ereboglobus sp. PH5-10 TaxID=2940629 RepID=UPI0024075F10|nr:autotransporter outer membrane beta-barrel domain-containing protein [Ereboglobus sp. PH5-10]MDF9827904.1 uncharacterized protein with beta-barrel porin domain [Ereboglobus sp. PH5-10]
MKQDIISRHAKFWPAIIPVLCLFLTSSTVTADTLDSSTIIWTGTSDSDWRNAANWNLGRIPTSTDYIGMGENARHGLDIINTGAGDVAYAIAGLSATGNTSNYTITLQGSSAGLAILNVTGGGFYSVRNTDNDLPINVVLNDYSKITFSGANNATLYPEIKNATGRATLFGMSLTMHGNSTADFSAATSSLILRELRMDMGTSMSLGSNTLSMLWNSTFSGIITSSKTSGEALRVNGNGGTLSVLTSTGVITLAGSSYILVRNNEFRVDGVFNGNVNLQGNANAILGGSGFVVGTVTANSAAAIAPGSSTNASNLTITGTANMLDGSAINLNFFSTTQTDHLSIVGTLSLAMTGSGAGVNLGVTRDETNFVVKDSRYKVATVDGEIEGQFNEKLVHNFGPLAEESYWEIVPTVGGYEVWVNIVHGDFSSVTGLTSNQYVIANTLDRIQAILPDALIMSVDSQKTIAAYGKVLNQLGPQSYQSWFPAAIVQLSSLGASIENRLAINDEKLRETKKFNFYTQASRNTSTKNESANNEYYEIDPEEILIGADYAFSKKYLLGVVYAYDKTKYTLDDSGSRGESKSNTFGVYGRYRSGPLQASLIGFYGTDDHTANRSVALTKLGTYAKADTDGTRYGARALVSYTFEPGPLDFAPTLGLQYVKWKADGFTEAGNANEATLIVEKQEAESTIATFGMQLFRDFPILRGKAVIRPYLNAYWAYRVSSGERSITASVMGEAVTLKTTQPDRNGWHIEAGMSLDYANGLSLFASYGNHSNIIVDQTLAIRGGVGYRF